MVFTISGEKGKEHPYRYQDIIYSNKYSNGKMSSVKVRMEIYLEKILNNISLV